MLKVRNRLWVISDTHLGHKNIVQYAQRPETHDVIILSNWIDRVREDDQILHLGDVFMGSTGNARRWGKVLQRMPGEKYLMLGNHDNHSDPGFYEGIGFTLVEPFIFEMNSGPWKGIKVAVTHEPIGTKFSPGGFSLDAWEVNIHGHIHQGRFENEDKHEYNGRPIDGKIYINVCVEETDLAPIQLGTLLNRG